MTNEQLLKIKPNDAEERVDVSYTFAKEVTVRLPSEVVDTEDEELMAEYISKWFDDVDDIRITSF